MWPPCLRRLDTCSTISVRLRNVLRSFLHSRLWSAVFLSLKDCIIARPSKNLRQPIVALADGYSLYIDRALPLFHPFVIPDLPRGVFCPWFLEAAGSTTLQFFLTCPGFPRWSQIRHLLGSVASSLHRITYFDECITYLILTPVGSRSLIPGAASICRAFLVVE